jgi:two-component system, response regulator
MDDKTILLAEDDPAHAALIRQAIERVDCSCRADVVSNGLEVIDYLFATGSHADRDSSRMPDLIMLDLKMPKMDGLQVLQVLRRVHWDDHSRLPPVIILTSSKHQKDILDAYNLGAHSYIQKPIGFSKLVEAVRQIVEYWLGLNQYPPTRQHEWGNELPPNSVAGHAMPITFKSASRKGRLH